MEGFRALKAEEAQRRKVVKKKVSVYLLHFLTLLTFKFLSI